MRKPYRVIIWGPGSLGRACLKQVIMLPEFELAGVLCYLECENGKDAGELAGLAPVGVKATMNKDEIYALDVDCVLYTTADFGDFRSDEDILRLLESGKNVVTSLPYHYPAMRGPEVMEKLESACRNGRSTLHGSGIQPNFIGERLALTLTGVSNDVKYITMREVFGADGLPSAQALPAFGFGASPEQAKDNPAIMKVSDNYYGSVLAFISKSLGVALDRIEMKPSEFQFAPNDISTPVMEIKKGTVAAITHSWVAFAQGRPFCTLETNWYLSDSMRPTFATSDDCWEIIVEGSPSVRVLLDLKASVEKDLRFNDGDPTPPAYKAAAVLLVQAVPLVCAADPGILYPSVFAHWATDLRQLGETKRS